MREDRRAAAATITSCADYSNQAFISIVASAREALGCNGFIGDIAPSLFRRGLAARNQPIKQHWPDYQIDELSHREIAIGDVKDLLIDELSHVSGDGAPGGVAAGGEETLRQFGKARPLTYDQPQEGDSLFGARKCLIATPIWRSTSSGWLTTSSCPTIMSTGMFLHKAPVTASNKTFLLLK